MWNIVKSEFQYSAPIFLGMTALAQIAAAMHIFPPFEDFPGVLFVFTVMLYTAALWFLTSNKEKRNIIYIRLPQPAWKADLARIVIVTLSGLVQTGLHAALQLVSARTGNPALRHIFTVFGLYLLILLLKFILRNSLIGFFRNNRWFRFTRERSRLFLLYLSMVLNMFGLYMLYLSGIRDEFEETVLGHIRYLSNPEPFTGFVGALYFTGLCALLTGISVFMYSRRSSYME